MRIHPLAIVLLGCAGVSPPVPAEVTTSPADPPLAEPSCVPLANESVELEAGVEAGPHTTTEPGPCRVVFDTPEPANDSIRTYRYADGRLVALSRHSAAGDYDAAITTDEQGRPLTLRGEHVTPTGERREVFMDFIRGPCGKLHRYEDGRRIIEYDYEGGRIVGETRWLDGEPETRATHEYENGHLVRSVYRHSTQRTGEIRHLWRHGRLRERQVFQEGRPTRTTLFFYDERGRLVREQDDLDGIPIRVTRRFDEHGNVVEERNLRNGELSWTRTYEYDCR